MTASPASTVYPGIVPLACGGRLPCSTSTRTSCVTDAPPGSLAVTVTVAVPALTAEIVATLPATEAVATAASEVVAAYISASSSGSLK